MAVSEVPRGGEEPMRRNAEGRGDFDPVESTMERFLIVLESRVYRREPADSGRVPGGKKLAGGSEGASGASRKHESQEECSSGRSEWPAFHQRDTAANLNIGRSVEPQDNCPSTGLDSTSDYSPPDYGRLQLPSRATPRLPSPLAGENSRLDSLQNIERSGKRDAVF
ncbi:hypothetical protein KM043_006562 [Ampulex compressa]|nr:hypothetical protein KM043_006562 [Ampulex compressa]